MDKISVIVPIYNVEKYLSRCLESVITQTFKDIEILCINDCSLDKSANILEEYAKKDNRIKIINREKNGGLSAARNSGLRIAQGKYIYFLDSDDWIAPDYLEKMYKAIAEHNQNAVCNTNIIKVTNDGAKEKLIKRDFDEGLKPYTKACQMAWSWILRKDFLDKFDTIFPEGLKYEDIYFFNVVIRSLKNVYIINASEYFHFENTESIMGCDKNRTIDNFDCIEIIKLIYTYYKKNNLIAEYSIPFFYYPKYMINIHKDKSSFYYHLKMFYDSIKEDVLGSKHLYSKLELQFFNEILDTENYQDYKKNQSSIIGALRKNIRRTNAKLNK